MNLLQMRTRARERFRGNELDDTVWTNHINETYKQFLSESHFFIDEELADLVVTAGSRSVDLPADISAVLAVRSKTHGLKLSPVDGHRVPFLLFPDIENDSAESPNLYRVVGRKLFVYPKPLVNTTLEVVVALEPPDLTADLDVPILPTRYHPAIVSGALALAYIDDTLPEKAAASMEFFNDGVRRAKSELTGSRSERFVEIVDDFYGG